MNHVTVGVYKNGEYVINVVRENDLESHIEYNQIFRFGRALFVDGKCVNQGYLSDDEIKNWTEKIMSFKINTSSDTRPYR